MLLFSQVLYHAVNAAIFMNSHLSCLHCIGIILFTNILVDKALQVIRIKLHNEDMLADLSVLQVEAYMELLEVCLRTTYFQVDNKFLQQKDGCGKLSIIHC
jgi:hypothetical protein